MFKRFMKMHRKENMIILFFTLGQVIILVMTSLMLSWATNELLAGRLKGFLLWNSFNFFWWGILFIINYYLGAYEEKVVQRISMDMRAYITNKLEVTTYQNVKSKAQGTFVSWLNNDIEKIQEQGVRQYYTYWGQIFSIVLSSLALLSFHYSLLLLTLVLVFLLTHLPKAFEGRMNQATQKLSLAQEAFVAKIQDTLAGFDIFYGFNRLPKLRERVTEAGVSLLDEQVSYTKDMKIAEGSIGYINVFCQVAVVTFTGVLAFFRFFKLGAMSSTGNLSASIFNGVSQLSQSRMLMKATDAYFEKYEAFEAAEEEERTPIPIKESIEIRDLTYKIAGKTIFSHLNLKFEKGKKYAIIGESGSGKSTLLNILSGRLEPNEGEVLVDGQVVQQPKFLRDSLTYIPQVSYIFSDTILHNMTLWEEQPATNVSAAYEATGLNSFTTLAEQVEEGGKNMSGGQRQRLSFSRALLNNKDIYFLDESTANLDRPTAIKLERLLLEQEEATVLLVTHHLYPENEGLFDEVIHLNG